MVSGQEVVRLNPGGGGGSLCHQPRGAVGGGWLRPEAASSPAFLSWDLDSAPLCKSKQITSLLWSVCFFIKALIKLHRVFWKQEERLYGSVVLNVNGSFSLYSSYHSHDPLLSCSVKASRWNHLQKVFVHAHLLVRFSSLEGRVA